MKIKHILIVFIITFPFFEALLERVDSKRGMIWLLFNQIYYFPLGSWLKEPFFKPDSELLFQVLLLGKIITPLFYLFVLGLFLFLRNRKII
jgi:hypothetical protein